jgi:hypothetical protein
MTAEKKTDSAPKTSGAAGGPGSTARKAWTPKSTVEVVLDQIAKQEKRVADLQHALDIEKSSLTKLLQAKKVLEAT